MLLTTLAATFWPLLSASAPAIAAASAAFWPCRFSKYQVPPSVARPIKPNNAAAPAANATAVAPRRSALKRLNKEETDLDIFIAIPYPSLNSDVQRPNGVSLEIAE